MEQDESRFIYLDGELERKQLIQAIHQVRQDMVTLVEHTPEDQWYVPRYHGWTLAAMLGHLNLSDNIYMFLVRAALVGFTPRISSHMMDRINNFTTRLFAKRLVPASLKSMGKNQVRIDDLIFDLPMDKFTQKVYFPPLNKRLLLEQAVQVMFLHHWEDHLQSMQQTENNPQRTSSDKNRDQE